MLSVNKIELYNHDIVTLFRLRNPWSFKELNGDWSEDSDKWDDYTKKQIDFKKKDDGSFLYLIRIFILYLVIWKYVMFYMIPHH